MDCYIGRRRRVRLWRGDGAQRHRLHTPHSMPIKQFFSRSADKADLGPDIPIFWRRVLSNFWACEISVSGASYPSVESAFQAAKATHSDRPHTARWFEVDQRPYVPGDVKRAGSKRAYQDQGMTLDAPAWDARRDDAMGAALQARHDVDPLFRAILAAVRAQGVTLLHFERCGARSYWGGSLKHGAIQGSNTLGALMMRLPEAK
jgi:predicted NAD-dependent protein-ADP-ribosyltransferase YbiA (DUF1768 family)